MSIDTTKTYHLVGIGGVGMSGIAWLLRDWGACVTGSDRSESSVTARLREAGIPISIGHRPENVEQADLLVASAAVPDDNVELQEARSRGIEVIWRADMLGRIMSQYRTRIAVAGTHGKTTTTAMVGLVLIEAGLDPTVLVGGDWDLLGGNARIGKSDVFVTEACEAFDSYLHLRPNLAVVTNVEADHLDFHGNFKSIMRSFDKFLSHVDKDGAVVACTDDLAARELMAAWPLLPNRILRYGFDTEAQLRAENVHWADEPGFASSAVVVFKRGPLGELKLKVPGQKNILNALAAVGVGLELSVPFETSARALAKFTGVDRRFQVIGKVNDVTVVDDYAHHPTEIEATLDAARSVKRQASGRLVAIFQPHLYSRTQYFMKDFAQSLSKADMVVVTDVYAARENPIPGAAAADIVELINARMPGKALYIHNKDEVAAAILGRLQPEDMVLVMGAGDIWQVGGELVHLLESSSPMQIGEQ